MTDVVGPIVQAVLFALFAGLTLALQEITGPTYQGLLVPELAPSALFPPFPGGAGSFYARPIAFSEYLLVHVADPAVVLVALALGLLYLARSFLGRELVRLEGALPRAIVYVVLGNLAVPLAGAVLDLAGSIYPTVAGFDGGAWQNWASLAGVGGISFSWDNGALAFIVSFVLFGLVLALAAAVALRDAVVAVLIVLLPVLTIAGGVPFLRPLARRAWLLFAEAAFLPCVLVIPLELAVGSPSVLLLLGYLAVALGSPALLSLAGNQLSQLGYPSAGGALSGGLQRGLGIASLAAGSYLKPLSGAAKGAGAGRQTLSGLSSAVGSATKAPLPAAIPLAVGELLGRGGLHLARHLRHTPPGLPGGRSQQFGPVQRRSG